MSKMTLNKIQRRLTEGFGNNYLLLLAGIILFSAAIRFQHAFFEGMWVDESRHARLAIELPKHFLTYSLPDVFGQLTKIPPVYQYLLAISNSTIGKVFGTDFAIRIVSPLMGTLTVISSYLLGREILNKRTGIIAASLVSVNGLVWFLSERILMGATLTFFFTTTILAFYYGLEDKKYSKYAIWSWGPLVFLTALSKQPGYVLGPVILIYFLYKKRSAISDYFMTDKNLKDSDLWIELTNRNYYIALGLLSLLMMPWMARNIGVCDFPLCSVKAALNWSGSAGLDVRGTFFFLTGLPGILTIPIASITAAKLLKNFYDSFKIEPDLFVKKTVLSVILIGISYSVYSELTPLMIVGSLAMFATRNGEKLLLLAAAFGLGIMSIGETKVPRYIVFVIPSVLVFTAISIDEFSKWLQSILDQKIGKYEVKAEYLALIVIIPLLAVSYINGIGMVSGHSFQKLEPAGEWLSENTDKNDRFMATSPQYRYYTYPRTPIGVGTSQLGNNETEFRNKIAQENVSFVVVDVYERVQPDWISTGIPPYRITQELAGKIRSGEITGREAFNQFKQQPSYLVPVQRFGETQLPLTRQSQPQVIIYEVNRSVL